MTKAWEKPQGSTVQDMEDLLLHEYESAVDAEEHADEAFAVAFHNWEIGEAGLRIDIIMEDEGNKRRKGEAHVTAMLKMARQGSLKPLWDAYQETRKAKALAHANRKKIEIRMGMEKSKSYRKRV